MNGKTIFTLVAALTLVTIGASALILSDESSNAHSGTQYQIYVEVVEMNGTVSNTVTVTFICDPTNTDFARASTEAFEAIGLPLVMEESYYGITVIYDGSMNAACYFSDGTQWVAISDTSYQYIENTHIALAVGTGYIDEQTYNALPASEQASWQESGWGGDWAYMKVPAASPVFLSNAMVSFPPIVSTDREMAIA